MHFRFSLFLFFFLPGIINAKCIDNDTTYFILKEVQITGNKKTKSRIITREIKVQPGDTIFLFQVNEILLTTRNRIFNTGLFLKTEVSFTADSGNYRSMEILVKERLYTYPIPMASLADRNFNEWWYTRKRDLTRLEYGMDFIQKNMRGRNETLRIKVNGGFSTKAELTYLIPYINKKQNLGLSLFTGIIKNRRIAYRTGENILIFHDDPEYVRTRINAGLGLTYRRKFYEFHVFSLSYYRNSIADTIARLNPDYFLQGRKLQEYLHLRYSFIYDRRDITYYPLKGKYFRFDFEKIGLGTFDNADITSFRSEVSGYLPLSKRFYASAAFINKYSLPDKQPYFNLRGLGYLKDYVSGYELYVIDGTAYTLFKTNLKYKLLSMEKGFDILPGTLENIPIAIFLKAYYDAGYVMDPINNPGNAALANSFLNGGGIGFDIVTYYDMVFRFEYSFNRMMERGLFFSFKTPFN
ncbi:MAG: BamA/TamA family outer membrane protein [Cytophagaceae bacterium]